MNNGNRNKNSKIEVKPIDMNLYEIIKKEINGLYSKLNENFLIEGPEDSDIFSSSTSTPDQRPRKQQKQQRVYDPTDPDDPTEPVSEPESLSVSPELQKGMQKGFQIYHTILTIALIGIRNNNGKLAQNLNDATEKLFSKITVLQSNQNINKEQLRRIVFQIADGTLESIIREGQEESQKANIFKYAKG